MLAEEVDRAMRALVDDLLAEQEIGEYIVWYYTPMALPFSEHLQPRAVVYDCMDELSAFKNAPPALCEREARLFELADVVFTGGFSLFEAKRDRNPNVHPFPSSIDAGHFGRAKERLEEPADQVGIARPRLGFFGVVDERMDLALLEGVANLRPEWQIVVVGPVVKIDPESLPKRENIHFLGGKQYSELPDYIAGWDVAIMPFARNESTRFISPTKTPEYLAAGKPVVSTSIRDVVRPYGTLGIVEIADTPEEFVAAVERVMQRTGAEEESWRREVEKLLSSTSWDLTWTRMWKLIDAACASRAEAAVAR
jgi:UDP-galactopyranose mutase